MNEVFTYLPHFIWSLTRSQTGLQYIPVLPMNLLSNARLFFFKLTEREQEIYTLKQYYQKEVQENWNMCKAIESLKVM